MKFTWQWLQEHLHTEKDLSEILSCLPMIGLEVEEVTDKSEKLREFVIAKITECKQHPNAEVCTLSPLNDEPTRQLNIQTRLTPNFQLKT